MIIARAPFRMSFFGGGTDYPPFFREHGGSVLSTTFDKYAYVTVRHLPGFFDYKTQVSYSRIERVRHVSELEHPLVREAMKYLDMHRLHIAYDADLPARSGLGSSSAFAAALMSAFHALKGQYRSPEQLAKECIYVERTLCQEDGGWQDQIASCYGGFNRIDFKENSFDVTPVIVSKEKKQQLNDSLMLFFTGFTRLSSEIAKEQVKAAKSKEQELLAMLALVDEAERILIEKQGNLDDFGRLLHETWRLKRGVTDNISTSELDNIYAAAMEAGALGGKLLGAGGGGFFVFYVPREHQAHVRKALETLLYVPFQFENEGTKILYYDPEDFDPVLDIE